MPSVFCCNKLSVDLALSWCLSVASPGTLHQSDARARTRLSVGGDGRPRPGSPFKQEFRALETLGKLCRDRLLDHARPGKADEHSGLGECTVAWRLAKLAVTPPVAR